MRILRRSVVVGLAVLFIAGVGAYGSKGDHNPYVFSSSSSSGMDLIYQSIVFTRVTRNPFELNLTKNQRDEFAKLRHTYREKFLKINGKMVEIAEELDTYWNKKDFDPEVAKAKIDQMASLYKKAGYLYAGTWRKGWDILTEEQFKKLSEIYEWEKEIGKVE